VDVLEHYEDWNLSGAALDLLEERRKQHFSHALRRQVFREITRDTLKREQVGK
jgi:hypothetical protein